VVDEYGLRINKDMSKQTWPRVE